MDFEEEVIKELRSRRKTNAKFQNLMYIFHQELKRETRILMDAYRNQVEKSER